MRDTARAKRAKEYWEKQRRAADARKREEEKSDIFLNNFKGWTLKKIV